MTPSRTTEPRELQIAEGFSNEQIEIIRSQVAPPGTTNEELRLFLLYCQRTGLDPFARQIYLSERRSQVNGQWVVVRKPETTIEGFRVMAERSGQYAGQLGPEWCDEDGIWKNVWTPQKAPLAARVGILRHDFKEPLWAVALYYEYVQTKAGGEPNSMWNKMPANQLAKCAESLALRRAFPREINGIYTKEEMPDPQSEAREAQADVVRTALEKEPARPVALIEDRKAQQEKEAEEILNAAASEPVATVKGKKPPKIPVSAQMLQSFGEVKKLLREQTGDDTAYYEILKSFGYAKSNEILTREDGSKVYKALTSKLNVMKQDKDLRHSLEHSATIIGPRFVEILGAHGMESVQMVLDNMAGDPLAALLSDLKAAVDQHNARTWRRNA